MARPVCVLLLLLACAAGVAACGGDDGVGQANAYVAKVNAAQDRFLRSAQTVQDEVSTATSTPGQTRRALDAFSAAVRRAVGELRAITPPGEVTALHARLVAALASYEPVIAARRAVASSGDGRALITARTRFSTDSEAVTARIQRAIERINAELTK
jgi:hypothetical protein